jgi:hypothetical protein
MMMFHAMKIIAILCLLQINLTISSTQLHEDAAVDVSTDTRHLRGGPGGYDTTSSRVLMDPTTTTSASNSASTTKGSNPAPSCPLPTGICSAEYSPRICSKGPYKNCMYPNACYAASAGFNVNKQCVLAPLV